MIRKAKIKDAEAIQEIVNHYARLDQMLARSLNEIYENIRDFSVYDDNGRVVGCAALHVCWSGLGEVRSLAVREDARSGGIGRSLLRAAIEEARGLEIARLFTLTYVPGFFEKEGFKRIDKAELPHKVWTDCLRCPKFPNCDEVALALGIAP